VTDIDRDELLDRYEGLRVTDVTDGMDFLGFHEVNRMDSGIAPLYRDPEDFSHRFVGLARTVRFHPTNDRRDLPATEELDFETATAWRDQWYDERVDDPGGLQEGDVMVVEAHNLECGIIGSMNSLGWVSQGAVGVITNGGPRDTDEIIKQGTPIYARTRNKTIIPGRTETDAVDVPVNVGGALVRPGDVIVADGDGVVVVPVEHAGAVAEAARREQEDDQQSRRAVYEELGMEPDFTLE